MLGQLARLTKQALAITRREEVCHRLMSVPGVGPITALAFRATIDRPGRFRGSRDVGAHLGLTPARYHSGETDTAKSAAAETCSPGPCSGGRLHSAGSQREVVGPCGPGAHEGCEGARPRSPGGGQPRSLNRIVARRLTLGMVYLERAWRALVRSVEQHEDAQLVASSPQRQIAW